MRKITRVSDNMKVLIVFSLVVVAALAEQKNFTTLKDFFASYYDDRSGVRIIDGLPASVGQFPWQVAVIGRTSSGSYFCGGTLIDNQWVLTAGHCVDGALSFTLYLGGTTLANSEEGRLDIVATDYTAHPNYNPNTLNNDIAVIRLPEPVVFNSRISAIRLPQSGEILPVGSEVTVSGWGKTSDASNSVSQTLNYVDLTIIPNLQCASVYGSSVVISSTVCAVGNPHHSTCNGDSGGPLILTTGDEPTLHGVVSFVHINGCASGNPSGYVRVESQLSWIHEVTGV